MNQSQGREAIEALVQLTREGFVRPPAIEQRGGRVERSGLIEA
jgi:hypothetical protein